MNHNSIDAKRKNKVWSIFLLIGTLLFIFLYIELAAFWILTKKPTFRFLFKKTVMLTQKLQFEMPESFSKQPVVKLNPAEDIVNASMRHDQRFLRQKNIWLPQKGKSTKVNYISVAANSPVRKWQANFTTDEFGRRITPWHKQRLKSAKFHLLGLGCSLTWGVGVSNEETFLAKMTEKKKNLISYNLSFEGYGPGELIARMKYTQGLDQISPKQGAAIYFMHTGHIKRFLNSMSVAGTWRPNGLVMSENEQGKFELLGGMENTYPVRTALYKILAKSSLLQLFGFDYPFIGDNEAEKMARAILEMRNLYRESTQQNNSFIVVLLPMGVEYRNIIRTALNRAKILFVDYSDISVEKFLLTSKNLPNDSHFSAELHAKLADVILKDLQHIIQ